ncbi:MAG TPA: cysteine--tRNA ligase [Burkholderiaceae bacterium]|nr:cysteine--tRNA ligase [Burkholderiaceae bacterium]
MAVRLYNTLTRKIQDLAPLEPGHVRMYVCGMTTYDLCHIGHARLMLAFDIVQRWLRASGLRVTYVRNITDIDDKIIRRAQESGETVLAVTERNIQAMHEDLDALGIQRPDIEPRATRYVAQMLDLIGVLQGRGLAYLAEDGDVDFAVRKFPGYGKLSGKSIDELRAGERVGVRQSKRDPLDFVLWKHAKLDEPQWPSAWGPGRPGWHIECSAMASATLGRTIDIHGGGPDLIFPHHENEIAQSEGAYGVPLANVWMHCGALRVGEEKMSKSLGNFLTIRDALKRHRAEVLRFFLVRTHYRGQISFTEDLLADARSGLTRLYTALRGFDPTPVAVDWNGANARRFAAAMDEDFNTPAAIAELFDLAGEVNRGKSPLAAKQLRALGGVLGLLQQDPETFLQADPSRPLLASAERVQQLVDERAAAKKSRNFQEADRIRALLAAEGVLLEDGPSGTTWRRN